MRNQIGPSIPGARAAKELLLRIERTCKRSIAEKGEIDPIEIASLLEVALADPFSRPGVMLALGEVIGMSVTGSPIDPRCWTPLKYFTAPERAANLKIPLPTKRF